MFGWARAGKQRPDVAPISIALIAVLGIACALFPAFASGATATGEITRAEASPDWTAGSFAGSVHWGPCDFPGATPLNPFPGEGSPGTSLPPKAFGSCEITPYATVAPGDDPAECWTQARRWPHSAGSQVLVWEGATRTFAGSAAFDVASGSLSGTPGQLLCLSVLQIYEERPRCGFPSEIACILPIVWYVSIYRVAAAGVLPESGAPEFFGPVPMPPETAELPDHESEEKPSSEEEETEQGRPPVSGDVSPPNTGGPEAPGAPIPPAAGARRRCVRAHSHRSQKKGERKHRGHRSHKKCAPSSPR